MENRFDVPILFLIFNRPETTYRVFEKIRKIKPKNIYIAADGPRNENEKIKCLATRAIIERIDWDCRIETLFRKENLGCKYAVSSALNWFFENEEEGIILEDDCLPSSEFFFYCKELLSRYRENKKIMHIGGANCLNQYTERFEYSYRFSAFPEIWGWASWRRAWKNYDISMSGFQAFKKVKKIRGSIKNILAQHWWMYLLNKTYKNKVNTWDFQWCYSIFKNEGVTIMPNKNLIQNIGFGAEGTNTFSEENSFANVPLQKIFPLKHPNTINIDYKADSVYSNENLKDSIKGYMKRLIKK